MWRPRDVAPAEQPGAPEQFEVGAFRPPVADGQPSLGVGQAQLFAGIVQHRQIGLALPLEHIAHRPGPGGHFRGDVLRFDGGADP